MYVAVVGASAATEAELGRAEECGRLLAEAGCIVVTGGLGGVMEAASRGAAEAGGRTVGLLPGEDREAANPWVEIALPTGLGELRNGLVVRAADAVLAIGAWGTLSEIALACAAGRRVVGLGTWRPAPAGEELAGMRHVEDPALAVAAILAS